MVGDGHGAKNGAEHERGDGYRARPGPFPAKAEHGAKNESVNGHWR